MLRELGVRIGAFSVFLPALLRDEALAFAQAVDGGDWKGPTDGVLKLSSPAPAARVLSARGLRAVGGFVLPVLQLERLDELLRAGFKPGVGAILTDEAREGLGWTVQEAEAILRHAAPLAF